jgi:hypothetical protein
VKLFANYFSFATRKLGADETLFVNLGYEEDPPMARPLTASEDFDLVGCPIMFLSVLFEKADATLFRGSNCAFQPGGRAVAQFVPPLQPPNAVQTSVCGYDSVSGWRLRIT